LKYIAKVQVTKEQSIPLVELDMGEPSAGNPKVLVREKWQYS